MPSPVMYERFPVRIRELELLRRVWVSETMLRLTCGGPGAKGFVSKAFDEHVKIIFPDPQTGELRVPTENGDRLDWPRPFPTCREYTIRAWRPDDLEIDMDVVVHESGIASDWARQVQVGQTFPVAGPPGAWMIPDDYDFYVLIADETALPAVARWAEEAPAAVRGAIIVEVPGRGSEQGLDLPDGVSLTWLHTGGAESDATLNAARALDIDADPERVCVWLAGEAGMLKPLRRWARDELGAPKEHCSITGYWRRGVAHGGH
ncbi:MAG: siderophore-interacting protein [Flaviflexus sp.]|nr:siderophore-interacting protein [Flaviflexus sp.]